MKILIYSAYPGFTGSHVMALQIAVACRDAGRDVVAVSPGHWEFLERASAENIPTAVIEAPEELLQFGKALLKGSVFRKLAMVLTKILPYNLRVWRYIRARKIDIVYAAQERAVVQIGLGTRLAGAPLLWHIQSGFSAGPGLIHKLCKRLATRIVCVSKAVAANAAEVLGPGAADRLEVILNGIPDLSAESAGDRSGDGTFEVLFLGSFVPEKGPHHLINAVGELAASGMPKVRLRMGGSERDEPFMRYLKSLVAAHGLEERVEFLGFRNDGPDLIAQSDLIVCPSVERESFQNEFGEWSVDWKEGFCLVALEAMRASKPVIASDSYGLKEVVADGESGIRVPPGDEAALASAIRTLATDRKHRDELGRNGRRRFEEHFSLANMTGEFLRVFDDILEQ